MSPSSWFETRGVADAVLDVVFDADRKGNFIKPFHPHGPWFGVPLMPVLPSPHAWDCRIILDDLEPIPGVTYRLDGFFLSPETAPLALPAGSKFTVFPGRVVGHGSIVEWL
jgi:hypothetical protein